jgi:hypothetical protein
VPFLSSLPLPSEEEEKEIEITKPSSTLRRKRS